jgi:hypothetical protein
VSVGDLLARLAGVLLAAFAAEFTRRLAARQRRFAEVIDWIAEQIDEPPPAGGKSIRPRPIASTLVDERERKSDKPGQP